MGNDIEFDPARMREAATGMAGVAGRIDEVLSTLRSSTAAEGEPWGTGKIGTQFAHGDDKGPGYLEVRDGLDEVVGEISTLLDDYATGLDDSAALFEDSEQGSAAEFS
ncbi:hypothetical protein [Nocardia sp. NPDC019395]|uniref:WXG100 family type VII secretion target n=1 Tax=Nocardia sp. NPDC019395 TaxID=3154686 RepID=UPI0033D946AF